MIAAGSAGARAIAQRLANRIPIRGILSRAEIDELQEIADRFDTTIDIVGSRGSGTGRNVNKPDLPVGKGRGTRSDIDTRVDTNHPQSDAIIDSINNSSGGAANAGANFSTADRPTFGPFIRFNPRN